jgi:plastocyanin
MKGITVVVGLIAVLVVTACSNTSASTPTAADPAAAADGGGAADVTIKMTNSNEFQPATIAVARGTTVTWINSGQAPHTVTGDPSKAANPTDAVLPSGARAWDSGQLNGGVLNSGQSFSYTFDMPGDYTYFCIPHESVGMVAHISVTS